MSIWGFSDWRGIQTISLWIQSVGINLKIINQFGTNLDTYWLHLKQSYKMKIDPYTYKPTHKHVHRHTYELMCTHTKDFLELTNIDIQAL